MIYDIIQWRTRGAREYDDMTMRLSGRLIRRPRMNIDSGAEIEFDFVCAIYQNRPIHEVIGDYLGIKVAPMETTP